PCQPTATRALAGGTPAQSSPTSAATGTSIHAFARRHADGSARGSTWSDTCGVRWRRPDGVSTLMNTGPFAPGTNRRSTPAPRPSASSADSAAASSATTSAPTRSPSLASASAAYEAPPPRRQPRGSSSTRSRHAAPTTTTSGVSTMRPPGAPTHPLYTGIMHFCELHEGDDDVFADLLLVRDEEMEPEE